MKFEKSEAMKIKYNGLVWLRINQRCMFIATEVGSWNSDLLGINEKKMIEIEVKVSLADLKQEFRKSKHYFYRENEEGGQSYSKQWTPNVFYFAVPGALVDEAKALVEKRGPKYGIINSDSWLVHRRARKLHDRPPSTRVKATCALRMGSELIRFHEAWL